MENIFIPLANFTRDRDHWLVSLPGKDDKRIELACCLEDLELIHEYVRGALQTLALVKAREE